MRSISRFAQCCIAMKMSGSVTARAERDEILFGIITQPAARADVVYLEIVRPATILAAPPIAREKFAGEVAVGLGIKPQSRRLPFGSIQGCS